MIQSIKTQVNLTFPQKIPFEKSGWVRAAAPVGQAILSRSHLGILFFRWFSSNLEVFFFKQYSSQVALDFWPNPMDTDKTYAKW